MHCPDDTIVAISTAAGSGIRAIVRLSGPQACSLAEKVFRCDAGLSGTPGFCCVEGSLALEQSSGCFGEGAALELPARAYVFRRPRSYTRQDLVELHMPGAAAAAVAVSDALIAAGARQAAPGEFTARAFFSGRIDLSQAESVADVINAADASQLRAATACLRGHLGRLGRQFSMELTQELALVEASIDLADQDLQIDSPQAVARRLEALGRGMSDMAAGAVELDETARSIHVVLAGRPNVGKSSLLNALSGVSRSIVSALSGTTRDVLSAGWTLAGGQAVTLQDAAGFGRVETDLAAAAEQAARGALAQADAILFVADLDRPQPAEDRQLLAEVRRINPSAPILVLANKADTCGQWPQATERLSHELGRQTLAVSALSGLNLTDVGARLAEMLNLSCHRGGDSLGLRARHRRCLAEGTAACLRAADVLGDAVEVADVAELAAVELRLAIEHIAALCPSRHEAVSEEVLAQIFSRFCVGK